MTQSSILYEGPSMLDGQPIVVIMTVGTDNRKTGDLAQTWIMRQDLPPHEAAKNGQDSSVCGDCPLRWSTAKGTGRPLCYVIPYQAPLSIWKAYKRGSYPRYAGPHQMDIPLRLGSYGDPAAVPIEAWPVGKYTLGYTHAWDKPVGQPYKGTCMASVNTPEEAMRAHRNGWRFFATWKGINQLDFESLVVRCPSDPAGQEIRKCDACRLCDGHRANVWIKPH